MPHHRKILAHLIPFANRLECIAARYRHLPQQSCRLLEFLLCLPPRVRFSLVPLPRVYWTLISPLLLKDQKALEF